MKHVMAICLDGYDSPEIIELHSKLKRKLKRYYKEFNKLVTEYREIADATRSITTFESEILDGISVQISDIQSKIGDTSDKILKMHLIGAVTKTKKNNK